MLNAANPAHRHDADLSPSQHAYRLAVKHSARVRRLKILLPAAALVISLIFVAVSIVRTYLPDNIELESARIENGKVVMEKPAISGRNKDGISYSMTAVRALQDIRDPNMITLENIRAAVPVNDQIIARVIASVGIYDRNSDRLDMTEPFTITLNTGMEAKFKSAFLDIKSGEMHTEEPVSITSKQASILAQSLKMTDKGRTITFAGNVRMNIAPREFSNDTN